MGALFQNFAVRQHDDVVRVLDGGQAVRHDQHGADGAHLFQRVLNQDLGFGVDVGGRLVKDHHAGLVQDGAGKAEQLPLTGREVVAALPHFLVQTVVELVDEVVGVDIAADLQDLIVRDALFPQDDVAADGAREEEHILQHLAEVTAERGDLDLPDVDAVNEDLALLELVVPADERKDGALARAGGADKGHRLPRVDVEGNALQHPLARDIAEPDVLELDLPLHLVQLDGVRGIHQLGLDVHDGEHLLRGRKRRLQPVELLGKVLDGGEELGDVHIEGDDGAAGNGLAEEADVVQMPHAAQIEQAEDGADVEHIDQRAEYAEYEDLLLIGASQLLAFPAEILHLGVLAAKDLGHLDARKILRQVGVDVGGRVLELAVGSPGELAEDDREDHDEGHKAEHHQGQLVVQADHCDQDAEDDEAVLGQLHQQIGEHHRDGIGVVGHTGDQLAHRDLIELLMGERLDVGEQVLAQIGDDPLADPLQDDGLKIGACHREHQHTGIDGHRDKQLVQGEIARHQLFDGADNEG